MEGRGSQVHVCDSCSQVLHYHNQCLQSPCKCLGKRCQDILSVNISHNGESVTAWYYFLEAPHCYGIRLSQVSEHLPATARRSWLAPLQAFFLMTFPSNTFPYGWPHLDCHVCEQDFSFGVHAGATPLQVFPLLQRMQNALAVPQRRIFLGFFWIPLKAWMVRK